MNTEQYKALCALEDEASTALCALEDEASTALGALNAAQTAFDAVAAKYANVLPPIIEAGDPTGMLAAALNTAACPGEEGWEVILVANLREAIMHEDEFAA